MTRKALTPAEIGRAVAVPLAVWSVATGIVFVTCALSGRSPFRTGSWDEGDPTIYLDIARHGYSLSHCSPGGSRGVAARAGSRATRCSSARSPSRARRGAGGARARLGIHPGDSGAPLVDVSRRSRPGRGGDRAPLCGFVPGQAWGYGIYPVSMLAFCPVAYLWLLTRERWLAAGLTGSALVLVYPLGVLARPLQHCGCRSTTFRYRCANAFGGFPGRGPPAVAIGLFLLLLQATLGIGTPTSWSRRSTSTACRTPDSDVPRGRHAVRSAPFGLQNMANLQTFLVTAFSPASLVVALRRRERAGWEHLVVLWTIATWLIPGTTTHIAAVAS